MKRYWNLPEDDDCPLQPRPTPTTDPDDEDD